MGSVVKRVSKDPLFLFLVAGIALFAVYRLAEGGRDPRHIRVNAESLTAFVQHRSQLQDPARARARLAGMSDAERQLVIDSYVREEALYREALRLGFDDGDYVIRRRLGQKVEFMADGAAAALPPLDDDALREWFTGHRDDYLQAPTLTLTHVFFDASRRGAAAARQAAQQALHELSADGTGFNEASGRGDAFPYHRTYAESAPIDLAGHFGQAMADALFELQPGAWQGPLQSPYGLHLVLVAEHRPGRMPEFEEVRDRVRIDAAQARRRAFTEARIDGIVGAYRVTVDSDFNGSSPGGGERKKQAQPSRLSNASSVNPDS